MERKADGMGSVLIVTEALQGCEALSGMYGERKAYALELVEDRSKGGIVQESIPSRAEVSAALAPSRIISSIAANASFW